MNWIELGPWVLAGANVVLAGAVLFLAFRLPAFMEPDRLEVDVNPDLDMIQGLGHFEVPERFRPSAAAPEPPEPERVAEDWEATPEPEAQPAPSKAIDFHTALAQRQR